MTNERTIKALRYIRDKEIEKARKQSRRDVLITLGLAAAVVVVTILTYIIGR